jgi:hypothetical protein
MGFNNDGSLFSFPLPFLSLPVGRYMVVQIASAAVVVVPVMLTTAVTTCAAANSSRGSEVETPALHHAPFVVHAIGARRRHTTAPSPAHILLALPEIIFPLQLLESYDACRCVCVSMIAYL